MHAKPFITTAKCPDGTYYGAAWRADGTLLRLSAPLASRSAARRFAAAAIREVSQA